jgi:hypothetical protein
LGITLEQNYFEFNKQFYKQNVGLAMGAPIDETIAEFNKNGTNIISSIEKEQHNFINFLDLTIHRRSTELEFEIYRKPTQTNFDIFRYARDYDLNEILSNV